MFGKFIPKETSFFDFFEKHIELVQQAAHELVAMTEQGANIATHAENIRKLEHEADKITHRCIGALHKTFITPFDRGDIHNLIVTLDEIIDKINDGVSRIALYELKEIIPEVMSTAQVLIRSTALIADALSLLRNLANAKAINKKCIDIHDCESDADVILRSAMARLFKEEQDIRKLIQWKAIMEFFEEATDECEDVANIIEGVVIEAS